MHSYYDPFYITPMDYPSSEKERIEKLSSELRRTKEELAKTTQHLKKSAQLNFDWLQQIPLSNDEKIKKLEMICEFEPNNKIYHFKLAELYFKMAEYKSAHATIQHLKSGTDHSIDAYEVCSLQVNIIYNLALEVESEKEKLNYLLSGFNTLEDFSKRHSTDLTQLNEMISTYAVKLYNSIAQQLNEQTIPTYPEAIKIHKKLMSLHHYLKKDELISIDPLNNYPRNVSIYSLLKILNDLILKYNQEKIGSLFQSTKDKVCTISSACERAKQSLPSNNQLYVDLRSFLNYKQAQNPSLLEALQTGRFGSSGPHVNSFQLFKEKLNHLCKGLGDEIELPELTMQKGNRL